MFTLKQISDAHAKVKSGADFPKYIKDLKALGVIKYETFVSDGHTVFEGSDGFNLFSEPKYSDLIISDETNIDQFIANLKAHQQGKTDYMTFCNDCAKSGIEKWVVSMNDLTCTYFDVAENSVLQENIPQ